MRHRPGRERRQMLRVSMSAGVDLDEDTQRVLESARMVDRQWDRDFGPHPSLADDYLRYLSHSPRRGSDVGGSGVEDRG